MLITFIHFYWFAKKIRPYLTLSTLKCSGENMLALKKWLFRMNSQSHNVLPCEGLITLKEKDGRRRERQRGRGMRKCLILVSTVLCQPCKYSSKPTVCLGIYASCILNMLHFHLAADILVLGIASQGQGQFNLYLTHQASSHS